MTDRLSAVGRDALAVAIGEHRRGVRDPDPRIDEYIRGSAGLGWTTADATFKSIVPYTRNGQFEWCGAFAAFAWGSVGLDARVRHKRLASCYRLSRWGRGIALAELRPGDIAVVSGVDAPAWGSHVVLVERVRGDGLIDTVEGNATGRLGDGSIGEGVVRRTRPVVPTAAGRCPATGLPSRAVVRFAYRPTIEDLGGPR